MAKISSITAKVWNFIDKDLALRRDISRGLVNKRRVASYIKKSLDLDVSLDAIISAIRRYPHKEELGLGYNKIRVILKESKISTKTNIALIAMKRENEVLNLLPNIFPFIELSRGDVMRLSEGRESIKILIDQKNVKRILKVIPETKILKVKQNLSELSIHFGKEANIGVIAPILTELAINNINIIEAISCLPEYMIFLEEGDLLNAYEILLKFLK